jgi:hypothetical protein
VPSGSISKAPGSRQWVSSAICYLWYASCSRPDNILRSAKNAENGARAPIYSLASIAHALINSQHDHISQNRLATGIIIPRGSPAFAKREKIPFKVKILLKLEDFYCFCLSINIKTKWGRVDDLGKV